MEAFYRAPTVKALVLGTVATFVARTLVARSSELLALRAPAVTSAELWRLLTWVFNPDNLASASLQVMLLFRLRDFERFLGSHKFVVFILVTWFVATSTSVAFFLATGLEGVHGGLTPFVFALLVLFFKLLPTPPQSYFDFAGLSFTEKSFTYALSALLITEGGLRAWIPALGGLLAGTLWLQDAARISSLRLPAAIVAFARSRLLPQLESLSPLEVERQRALERRRVEQMREQNEFLAQLRQLFPNGVPEGAMNPLARRGAGAPGLFDGGGVGGGIGGIGGGIGGIGGAGGGGGGGIGGAGGGGGGGVGGGAGGGGAPVPRPAPAAAPVRPDPTKLESLVAMGFSRGEAAQALIATDNNEEAAVNLLVH